MERRCLFLIEKLVFILILASTHNLWGASAENQKKIDRPWAKFLKKGGSLKTTYPSIKNATLSNGIEIYYLKNDLLPKIHLQIIIEGGQVEEPREKIGLTNLWGDSLVYSGSSKYPQEIISTQLENHASTFTFSSHSGFCSFDFIALSNFFEEDLKMLLQVINNPRFQPKDVELIRKQKIQSKKKLKENSLSLARVGAHLVYWGSHPRGMISTTKTISAIQHKDVQNWQKKMWVRPRIKVLLAGDINLNSVINILENNLIIHNKSKNISDINFDSLMHVDQKILKDKMNFTYHVHKEVPQSVIIWRAQAIPHHSKEYFALKVFNFILGGDAFNSFLTQDIRARRGWAYSVYSSYYSDKYGGYASIVAQTRNENIRSLIKRVHEILNEPTMFINQEKVNLAKRSIRNKFVFLYQTPFQLLSNIMILERHGLKKNYLSTFLENIDKVALNNVLDIAKKYYAPDNFFKIIVAPKLIKLNDQVKTLKVPE